MTTEDLKEIWTGLLGDLGKGATDSGRQVLSALADQAEFAANRAAHLQGFVGQPGYTEAVRAELDTILLRAGIDAATAGDAFDERLSALVTTALNALSRAARRLVA